MRVARARLWHVRWAPRWVEAAEETAAAAAAAAAVAVTCAEVCGTVRCGQDGGFHGLPGVRVLLRVTEVIGKQRQQ
jgi:hypothetical protein